jgi:hypothetical protein
MIMNFNDHKVIWDTDIIPMKDRGTLSSEEALIEVYMSANEQEKHKRSEMNILQVLKF